MSCSYQATREYITTPIYVLCIQLVHITTMTRYSNRNNSRRLSRGGRSTRNLGPPGWFSSVLASGDGEKHKHTSLRHRSLVSPRSSSRKCAILSLTLLTSLSMLANFQPVKDASGYLGAYTNNVKKKLLLDIPEAAALNSSLVIIMGNLRGGEQAWESLYKNVLDINSADLALIIGQTNTTSNNLYQNSSLYTRAKYIWTFKEYDDWADAIDLINGTTWRKTHLPHVPTNITGLFGGVKDHKGSGAIIFMIRWFLSQQLLHNPDILNRYERFVITRSDHYYQCQYEYKNLNLSNSTVWIPEKGEDYGGYTDRHIIVSRSNVLDALDILPTLLKHRRDMGERKHWLSRNPEGALEQVWTSKGINVKRTKRVMFTVATKFDTTRWHQASGGVPGVPGLFKPPVVFRVFLDC